MDLTEILNQDTPISRIDKYYEKQYEPRLRLGLSQAGHECNRFLWYKHNKYVEPDIPSGKLLRLFELGNKVEDLVINDLRSAGYTVTDEQKKVEFDWGNTKLKGSIDGLIYGVTSSCKPHLLEIKSSNSKRFKQLQKQGYEEWSDTYKFQIHAYCLGLGLQRILAVVYCKDNSELYTERISLDKEWITEKLEHVFEVISSDVMPDRKCPNKSWWKSRFCPMRKNCFG